MNVLPFNPWDKQLMAARGRVRVGQFCRANELPLPTIELISAADWHVNACAYYRKDRIRICLEHCARSARSDVDYRNWNWPGSTTDREPYGVLCHELGHHLDVYGGSSDLEQSYSSDYGGKVCARSGEQAISGYCPNDAEWFAEMARVFITNHALLLAVRPRTWEILMERWMPVSDDDWRAELGEGVPDRVIRALHNKMKGYKLR